VIIWPKYLFRYKEDGTVEGLIKNKKMVVITSRGGAYSGAMHPFDLQEPYLRALFGFIGITDIQFINAEPMDMGHELQTQKLEQAKHAAEQLALKTRFL
jgi:FMN-dependent NADH-azoreductase